MKAENGVRIYQNEKEYLMGKKVYLNYLVAGCLLLAVKIAGAEDRPASIFPLQVEQDRLVDSAGRQVILRGVNAGGRSKLPPFYPFDPDPDFETALEKYADQIQALGFNVVRLLIIYEAGEPVRGQYDEDYLRKYDRMVSAFSRRGIYIIIDSHQDLYSRRLCGDGLPDWALSEQYRNQPQHADCKLWSLRYFTNPVATTADRFWSNEDGIVDSYAAFFKMLAERYKNEPAVLGFEPVNEPFPGFRGMANYPEWYQEGLFALYRKVAEAVQSVEQRYLIFADLCPLENQGAWNLNLKKPELKNLVLAPHYYDTGTFGIALSPGGDQWLMRRGLKRDRALGDFWNAPVLVTEYGISPKLKNAPEYIGELYAVFDELNLSGTFWEASMSQTIWNLENTSILAPDGSVRGKALVLDRPYPRAVGGVIRKFSFDPETKKLELSWQENPEIKLPTEIYLPGRIYSSRPEISLEPGGDFKYIPDYQGLVIYPIKENSLRYLRVRP